MRVYQIFRFRAVHSGATQHSLGLTYPCRKPRPGGRAKPQDDYGYRLKQGPELFAVAIMVVGRGAEISWAAWAVTVRRHGPEDRNLRPLTKSFRTSPGSPAAVRATAVDVGVLHFAGPLHRAVLLAFALPPS